MVNISNNLLFQLCGDTDMAYPTHTLANWYDTNGLRTYRYLINFTIPHLAIFPEWVRKYSYHEIELCMLFGAPFSGHVQPFILSYEFTEKDKELSKALMTWWSNFAKYG